MKKIECNVKTPPQPVYTFQGNQAPVHSLNFLLNSKEEKLLVGARDGKIHVWDFEIRRQVHEFSASEGNSCISILIPSDDEMVSHARGEAIKYWSRTSGGEWRESISWKAPALDFCGAQLVEFGTQTGVAYPAGNDQGLVVRCPKSDSVMSSIAVPQEFGNVMGICHAGQNLLMAVFETGETAIWDLKSTKIPLSKLCLASNTEEGFAAMCITFDSESKRGFSGSSAASIAAFSMDATHNLHALPITPITNPGISCGSIRRDHKLVATAGWDSRVRLFSWRSAESAKSALRSLAVLESYTGGQSLQCVAFSPSPVTLWECNHLLAAAGSASAVCFWDIYN